MPFSTEDMAFEFKKAFQKATELRSLTFAQQWTMTDDSVFNSEQPVMASGGWGRAKKLELVISVGEHIF